MSDYIRIKEFIERVNDCTTKAAIVVLVDGRFHRVTSVEAIDKTLVVLHCGTVLSSSPRSEEDGAVADGSHQGAV